MTTSVHTQHAAERLKLLDISNIVWPDHPTLQDRKGVSGYEL